MCIFHEALSIDTAFSLSPVVVALSGLQKGCTLLNELSQITASVQPESIGAGSALLLQVAKDPYRYLRVMLSFEADKGHGNCAVNALVKELAKPTTELRFFDFVSPSQTAKAVIAAASVEETLRLVAIAGHANRPAFLEWFRDNPSSLEAPQAIKVLDRVAHEILVELPKALEKSCCGRELSQGQERGRLTGTLDLPVIEPLPVREKPLNPGCCNP